MDEITDEPYINDNEEQDGEEVSDVNNTVMIIAYIVIVLFSLVGNSLVIHIVRTRTEIRKKPFNWLLLNTAAADLVVVLTASAFSLPYYVCGDCWFSGVGGTILCKLLPFLLVASICVAIWTLTVIAVDRYLAIVRFRRKRLSAKSKVRCIIAVWLCAGVISCGQLYKYKTEETDDGQAICDHEWHEDWDTSTALYKAEMVVRVIITYAVPLLIMAVLYSLIAHFLWIHKPSADVNERAYAKKTKKRRTVIKMMITVVIVFAVCWLPVHISHIMSEFYSDAYDAIPTILTWLFYWLAHANAAIHPWLFIAFSEKLRAETKSIFRTICKPNQPRLRTESLPTSFSYDDTSPLRSGNSTARNGETLAMHAM